MKEGEVEWKKKRERLIISIGGSEKDDVNEKDMIKIIIVDLREKDVIIDENGIVEKEVEDIRVKEEEVEEERKRDSDKKIKELINEVMEKGKIGKNRNEIKKIEGWDGVKREGEERIMEGNNRKILWGKRRIIGIKGGLEKENVEEKFGDERNMNIVVVIELLKKGFKDIVMIKIIEEGKWIRLRNR